MKLKLTKPKNISRQLLFGFVLMISSLVFNVTSGQVYAAVSWPQLETKLLSPMRNYCAPVSGSSYDQCGGYFISGGSAVYNASSAKQVNAQRQAICTPKGNGVKSWTQPPAPPIAPCGAFNEGANKAQAILGADFYNGGGSGSSQQGSGGSGGQQGGSAGNVPPITDCNKAKNDADKRKCKQDYRDCNSRSTAAAKANCKKDTINEYTGGQQGQGGQQAVGGGGGQGGQDQGGDQQGQTIVLGTRGTHQCGNMPAEEDNWKTKLNFGCLGEDGPSGLGPIQDLLFALIRFLSVGVAVILTISIIAAGIQYTTAEGNAESTQKAKKRIQNAIIGLAIYIFAFAALQFLIPGGIFTGSWMFDNLTIIRSFT